jgi:hypothetical protein
MAVNRAPNGASASSRSSTRTTPGGFCDRPHGRASSVDRARLRRFTAPVATPQHEKALGDVLDEVPAWTGALKSPRSE